MTSNAQKYTHGTWYFVFLVHRLYGSRVWDVRSASLNLREFVRHRICRRSEQRRLVERPLVEGARVVDLLRDAVVQMRQSRLSGKV